MNEMSNQNGGIVRADEVIRSMQRAQEMQRQLCKQIVLASIDHCPVDDDDWKLRELWRKFRPTNQDGEVVYKFLSRCGCTPGKGLFRGDPWQEQVLRDWPAKFHSDPQAVLAFLLNDRRRKGEFNVPECFTDNKEVVMAVCAKYPWYFEQASSRLRDDEDLVQTALQASSRLRDDKGFVWRTIPGWEYAVIPYVSKRLLKDDKMILHAVTMGYCTPSFIQTWLRILHVEEMGIMEHKETGDVVLRGLHHYEPCELDFCFLAKFTQELCDDATFMLQFVKQYWPALEYCSERLRSNTDVVRAAVSQNINAYQYAKGPIRQQYNRQRTVDSVLNELDQGLYFENVPKKLKTNKGVILTALKAGQKLKPSTFPKELKGDKNFILDMIASHPNINSFIKPVHKGSIGFYCQLPEEIQRDEEVATALLEAGYRDRSAILKKVTSFLRSREAMLLAVKFPEDHYHDYYDMKEFHDCIAQCPFRDDGEFMLEAFKSNRYTFLHASERLRSTRDFVAAALALSHTHNLGYSFLTKTTEKFQAQNLDIIVEAIERGKSYHEWNNDFYYDDDYDHPEDGLWFSRLSAIVWSSKTATMACLRKGWSLGRHISLDLNSPLLHDKEIMFLSIKNSPSHLKSIYPALREDREFILELVTEIDSVLQHAPKGMKSDKKILLAALARSGGAICHCFDCFRMGNDFEFLFEFASQIRLAIVLHQRMVDPLCRLSRLNQGPETVAAFQTLFAEFADMPLLAAGLELLQAALTNMEMFGF